MQTVRINSNHKATISCNACGRWKTTDAGVFLHAYKPLRVSCPCGAAFQVIRELRQTYRKKTRLAGVYLKSGSIYKERQVSVKDVSRGGVALEVTRPHDLCVRDCLEVTFRLDNQTKSQVHEYGCIKHIRNDVIGVQFSADNPYAYRKDLGFYLMSA